MAIGLIQSRVLRSLVLMCSVLPMLVACVVLFGWASGQTALLTILPGLPSMKVNTAVCFILGGAALWLCRHDALSAAKAALRRPGYSFVSCAAFAASLLLSVIAALTFSEYLFGWDAGLDQLLFKGDSPSQSAAPGRMSAATAFIFCLLGAAFLLLAAGCRCLALVQTLALLALLTSLLALLAYPFGADLARATAFSSVALHTAINFFILSFGLICLHADRGWVAVFSQDGPSARQGRRYLGATVLALPLIAVLRLIGEFSFDWYDTYFGVALLTVGSIGLLTMLNWLATRAGNLADLKISDMQRVNATLSGINTLIVRVRSKPELFQQACQIATELGQFPWAWIATLDPVDPHHVKLEAWHGGSPNLLEGLQLQLADARSAPDMSGPIAQLAGARSPIVINDLAGSEVYPWLRRTELAAHRIQSLVLLPLVVADQLVGLFALHTERKNFFDAAEMKLLEELAGDISFAINHIDKAATLHYLAYYDALTGLPNRTLFLERLGRELQEAARTSGRVELLLGDIKRFRMINQTLGRHVGDELLRQFADRLRAGMEYPENLSRVQGDCFASFIPGHDRRSPAHLIHTDLGHVLDQPFLLSEQELKVEVNVGVAIFPEDGSDCETLIRNAESALGKAKSSGSAIAFYEPMLNARAAESLQLEAKLRKALDLGQFELHYQAKVDFGERLVHSVEALIRWHDPEQGLVAPSHFIPLLEEIGLIRQVGAWALKQAAGDTMLLRAMGRAAPRCAVNVSAIQLRDPAFAATVIEALALFEGEAPLLDIEITESLIMEDVEQASRVLQALRGLGVKIAVDDFGTGYSSLAYLARLPINALKIDRAFITGMADGEAGILIVASIISLAHALKLSVIAEGVETEQQADLLRGMNCDLMQGFLFSKAVPLDQLAKMLPLASG